MRFYKTTILASISTASTMLCGLITTKIIAVIIGPAGMALTGQFYSITAFITLLATAACTNGVIKFLAESDEPQRRKKIVQTAYKLTGIATVSFALLTILLSGWLSRMAFISEEYSIVFILYGVFLLFTIQNNIYCSILNGTGHIKEMTILTISISVFNMLFVVAFAHFYGIKGVLIASSISNVFVWVIGFYFVRRVSLAPALLKSNWDKSVVASILGFSAMSLFSGMIIPIIQFSIRSKLMHQISVPDAGLWQATTRLSDYYLTFINSVLMIYYLPKLSSISDAFELRKEILLGYARILPAVLVITTIIWLLRFFIISTFLTKDFINIIPLLKLYLIGDVLKIMSWILAFLMWAKAMKKEFIITEIIFAVLNIALSFVLINQYGILGTGWAYILLYTIYLVTMFVLMRNYIFPSKALTGIKQSAL